MQNECDRIIQNAARTILTEEGLFQKGRSRVWIDDNGWFLTIVEFQPSGFTKGSYLNVAIHYLWGEKNYFTHDYGGRIEELRVFSGDAELFSAEMLEMAKTAISQVREYRKFHDLKYAKRRVLKAKAAHKTHELYNKLMMCGLCKDYASRKYFRLLLKKLEHIDHSWEREIREELTEQIMPVIDDPQAMHAYVVAKILRQRDFWRDQSGMDQLRENKMY